MLLKKKNIVIEIPDNNLEKIKEFKEIYGYNQYDSNNIYKNKATKKRNI